LMRLLLPLPMRPTLFPYTTLFRSRNLFSPHCPLGHRPLVAAERRLVIAGEADRIVPPGHAEALAAHWQAPIEWFPGGHLAQLVRDRKSTRLNSSHLGISYAVFCWK